MQRLRLRSIRGSIAPMPKAFPPFAIFRAADAVDFDTSGIMSPPDPATVNLEASAQLVEAGMGEGANNELLFGKAGYSLTKVWFKSGFPLPRHSHDCDCLYYILAGSVRLGAEELGPGDGFFVGADVPYTYTTGENGVELLEFRASNAFDIKLLAGSRKWYDKALETVEAKRDIWPDEPRPSQRDG